MVHPTSQRLDNIRRLTSGGANHHRPVLNEKTGLIAFCGGPSGSSQVYVLDMAGRFVSQASSGGGLHIEPTWRADGSTIAYAWRKTPSGRFQIWESRPDGSESRCLLTSTRYNFRRPAYSVTGKYLFYQTDQGVGGGTNLWRVDLERGEKEQLTEALDRADSGPQPSPDGRWLLFEASASGKSHLMRMDLRSKTVRPLVEGGVEGNNASFAGKNQVMYEVATRPRHRLLDLSTNQTTWINGADGIDEARCWSDGRGHTTLLGASSGPSGRDVIVGTLVTVGAAPASDSPKPTQPSKTDGPKRVSRPVTSSSKKDPALLETSPRPHAGKDKKKADDKGKKDKKKADKGKKDKKKADKSKKDKKKADKGKKDKKKADKKKKGKKADKGKKGKKKADKGKKKTGKKKGKKKKK